MTPPAKSAPVKKATPRTSDLPGTRYNDTQETLNSQEPDKVEPDSPEQAELIDAGARPTQVDVDEMFKQIQRMQEQLNAMNKAQAQAATPDPISSGVVNLLTHLQAHRDANAALVSRTDDLHKALTELKEDGEDVSTDDVAELRILVDELAEDNPATDLSYVRRLARDLHKATLAER